MRHALLPLLLILAACAAEERAGEADNVQGAENAQAGGPAGPVTLAVPSDPDARAALAPFENEADSGPEGTMAALRARVDAAPADVRDVIERRAGCNHWSGEEGYDSDRRAQIAAALREARCDSIEADLAALRRRYSGDRAALQLIDDTADLSGF